MKTIFITALVLGFFSCQKVKLDELVIPDDMQIDVNQDGEMDFEIYYQQIQTYDIPVSQAETTCFIRPLYSNNFQMPSQYNSKFFTVGDTIKISDFWNDNPFSIGSIEYQRPSWDKEWDPNSVIGDNNVIPVYLNSTTTQIGWIEYSFDLSNGEFELVNSKLSDQSEIVIE